MVISSTSAVLASIQAVSPESSFGGASSANAGAAASRAGSSAQIPQLRRGRFIVRYPYCSIVCLKRLGIDFAGADPHGSFNVQNKNLTVADLSGVRGFGDGFDYLVGEVCRYDDLDLDLWQKTHVVFRTAVDFGLPLLATE